ncbi:hypothetical protein [Pandoraea faecigallinarum]|uniref:hypothetical protein n=1 Tax=Pandoraea faecigallinarum TaxID=656179 RepID=UPI001F2C2893|nr:hypothetical protein [Pandoraea faecigallinarum]
MSGSVFVVENGAPGPEELSVTVMLMLYGPPGCVGVPAMAPLAMPNPGGRPVMA